MHKIPYLRTNISMHFALPDNLGQGRLESVWQVFSAIKTHPKSSIELSFTRVTRIAPIGYAILACLSDYAQEHGCRLTTKFVKKKFSENPVIKNLSLPLTPGKLSVPTIHNFESQDLFLRGNESHIDMSFMEVAEAKFGMYVSAEILFSMRLIINELMQNTVDHSGAERYYLFAGLTNKGKKTDLQFGVLDMGVSVPAKLEQKYTEQDDQAYLELATKKGITTRRARPGGLGLFYTFEHLKDHDGTLTFISRRAQIIRYFKNKTVRVNRLKSPLPGTWCIAKLPVAAKK